jgi:hypothetical protein
LPDGTFADVFDVIENVVEHPVSLGAKARPIGRVESVAFRGWRIRAHIGIVTVEREDLFES